MKQLTLLPPLVPAAPFAWNETRYVISQLTYRKSVDADAQDVTLATRYFLSEKWSLRPLEMSGKQNNVVALNVMRYTITKEGGTIASMMRGQASSQ